MAELSSLLLIGSKQVLNQMLQKSWRVQKDTKTESHDFDLIWSRSAAIMCSTWRVCGKGEAAPLTARTFQRPVLSLLPAPLHIVLASFASGCLFPNY